MLLHTSRGRVGAVALALCLQLPATLEAGEGSGEVGGRLMLITPEEAAMPINTSVGLLSNEVSGDGPEIKIVSPREDAVYTGPFPIEVEFASGPNGIEVDMGSLKLEYKRAWGIDITDRVRDHRRGTAIKVSEAELPIGRHTVEIYIEDVEDHPSARLFTVIVRESQESQD